MVLSDRELKTVEERILDAGMGHCHDVSGGSPSPHDLLRRLMREYRVLTVKEREEVGVSDAELDWVSRWFSCQHSEAMSRDDRTLHKVVVEIVEEHKRMKDALRKIAAWKNSMAVWGLDIGDPMCQVIKIAVDGLRKGEK